MQLEELHNKVDELNAEVEKKNEEVKNKDATHKAALKAMEEDHKMAMDEKEKEAKSAMDNDHKKNETAYKSMIATLTAKMDDEKDENKKEGWKATLKAMEEEHMKESKYGKNADMDNPKVYEKSAEDKEKEREQTAQITYLSAQVLKPKIETLTQLYQASRLSDEEIQTFKAEWEKQSGEQLDAEISKMLKIVGKTPQIFEAEKRTPFGFSTSTSVRKQFDASSVHSKFDKMTDSQLFNSEVKN